MKIRLATILLALSSAALSNAPAFAEPAPAARTALPTFPIKQIDAGVLNVGYVDAGPGDGPVVILLHGWPYDIHSYIDVVPLLTKAGYRVIVPHLRGYGSTRFLDPKAVRNGEPASQAAGKQPLPPAAEQQWWYQFYFATERGSAGYAKNHHDFARLIWQTASPQWHFDDATFERSAASLENPDHVAITIHTYRWRLDLAQGEPQYAALEAKLAAAPAITVPTITMEGDANGAPHSDPASYAKRFP